ncbi:hypothetical protein MTR67_045436 [Solanum verrucosum]|uniref:Uncharacterized protein n=1 Tax=Solanum verrucosum TaxID=315347 RepID=A0AAF0ZUL2_SOLVR|nr:hypothetical protein MTR67_045436 [Solanum verrucosum]
MATPLIAGLSVAAAALAGRYGIQAWQAFKARPPTARMRKFYEGGFLPKMTRREAALILGVRVNKVSVLVKELAPVADIAGPLHKCGGSSFPPSFLGVFFFRESTPADKVREAHRKVMVANHPDAGGSHYLASKINEAKDIMLGKSKNSGSAF